MQTAQAKAKRYVSRYPDYLTDGTLVNVTDVLSGEDIIEEYYDSWCKGMVKKYGEGHPYINEKTCIEDWIVANWAYELKEREDEAHV